MNDSEPYVPPNAELDAPTPPQRGWLLLEAGLLLLFSAAVLAFPLYPEWLAKQTNALEAWGVVTLAWSVWLLARNSVWGWVVGLVGVVIYAVVFYRYRLYGEVGLQAFYFLTSVQAIVIWLRWGPQEDERPVGRVTPRTLVVSGVAVVVGTVLLAFLLQRLRGDVVGWDAFTTVVSVTAHLYLMGRYLESWYLWIAVDTIYVPLYYSRGLSLTAVLYVVFLILAVRGLLGWRALYAQQRAQST